MIVGPCFIGVPSKAVHEDDVCNWLRAGFMDDMKSKGISFGDVGGGSICLLACS